MPNPGPQSEAYLSDADELYFGGAAGGGKSFLLIGLGVTCHRNTLILRRTAKDTKALSKAIQTLGYGSWKWVGNGGELVTPDGRVIEVAGCQHAGDEESYQGQAHDLKAFDELPQFLESQYKFIIGWNRPLDPRRYPRQRCRVVGAGNPPTNPEGEWVLRHWRAWLDPTAGQLAKPGELRWYTTIKGEEIECADGRPVTHDGTQYVPRSRTFIPARLEDNPDLMASGYAATLEAMPEPLRSMLRYGDMLAAREDHRWQLIPTKWVVEANKRWARRQQAASVPLEALGVDVAMEGKDKFVIATRHGRTIKNLVKRKGTEVPDGQAAVALVVAAGGGDPKVKVNIDAIGIGKSAFDLCQATGLKHVKAVVVSNSTNYRDEKVPALKFGNVRAAMMWRVRQLLDPEGGPDETRLALPPDPELTADLCAPRYEMRAGGVYVERKEDIRERIGRSTDAGDAVALACWEVPGVSFSVGYVER